jgi:predicted DNA-binding transcriptional regulator YafY
MPTTASRLITLIMLLQRQPNQKARDLAAELGISVRTLHRYFATLDEMGIPLYAERGPTGGFSLVRGYKLPPLVFTPEEAAAVSLGTGLVEALWGELYRAAARGALAKLENLLPEDQRQEVAWARRSLVATGLHRAELETQMPRLEILRQAARERRRVRMTYRGRSESGPSQRDFDPYALVVRWGWWYTIGFCHKREAVRTFRVDRIIDLTLLPQGFEPPDNFDVNAYLAKEQAAQPLLRVRLLFTPPMAAVARESAALWEAMDEQADGSLVVTMTAPDLTWAASTVLAYGPGVTVLEPEEVRRTVREWAAAIAGKYSHGPSSGA